MRPIRNQPGGERGPIFHTPVFFDRAGNPPPRGTTTTQRLYGPGSRQRSSPCGFDVCVQDVIDEMHHGDAVGQLAYVVDHSFAVTESVGFCDGTATCRFAHA